MVTGLPDYQALSLNLTPALPNNDFAMTQCSHIFPDALGNIAVGGSATKVSRASTVISVVRIANTAGTAPGERSCDRMGHTEAIRVCGYLRGARVGDARGQPVSAGKYPHT